MSAAVVAAPLSPPLFIETRFLKHQLSEQSAAPQHRLQLRRLRSTGAAAPPSGGGGVQQSDTSLPDRLLVSFTYERALYRGLTDRAGAGEAPGPPRGPGAGRGAAGVAPLAAAAGINGEALATLGGEASALDLDDH